MNTIRNTKNAANQLRKVSMPPDKREEVWETIEERIDAQRSEELVGQHTHREISKRRPDSWAQVGAAMAAVAVLAIGIPVFVQWNHSAVTSQGNRSQVSLPESATRVQVTADDSQRTMNAGSLSKLIKSSTIHSHKFSGTSHTNAQVLASVEGVGTLVAENTLGYQSTSPAKLFFQSSKSQDFKQITKISTGSDVISSAQLSQHWIAWTDFIKNGVMANIGILNRATGKTWYVASQNRQKFLGEMLQQELFMRDNSLFVYGPKHVDEYNMKTHKWSTFYSAPSNVNISGLQVTSENEVVELTPNRGKSEAVVIDQGGKQVGPKYILPSNVGYPVGSNGRDVIFGGTYLWTPGSLSIEKVSDVSSRLSGSGSQYVAGWGSVSKQKGQLLDLQNKRQYSFNADSALITNGQLFWTTGNTVHWAKLPYGQSQQSQGSSQNKLFDTTLVLPTGKTVPKQPNAPVQWKNLKLSLLVTSLPPIAGPSGYRATIGNHATIIRHETVNTSAGKATLVYFQRTQPAAANSNTVSNHYDVILDGSQYAYVLQSSFNVSPSVAKRELLPLLNRWIVPTH